MSAYRDPEPPNPAEELAELRAFERAVGRGRDVPPEIVGVVVTVLFVAVSVAFYRYHHELGMELGVLAIFYGILSVVGLMSRARAASRR